MLLGAATALIAILGLWSDGESLATLWRFPAALLLAGLAYESLLVGRAHVVVRILAPDQWFLGRSAPLRFEFAHSLQRSLLIEAAPAAPDSFAIDSRVRRIVVDAAHAVDIDLTATPRRIGEHRWPPIRARVAGPLGLAWWSKSLATGDVLRVKPDVLRSDLNVLGLGANGARTGSANGAGLEILQLRPYRSGDPPRMLDWKATARAQRLISRDFSEDQHLEILIMIDGGRGSSVRAGELDRFGHYLNVAARLAQYAVTQDDSVGLIIFSDRPLFECRPDRGANAVTRIRRALGDAHVERTESNPLQAALRARALLRQRSLVVMLTDLDDATLAGQLSSAARLLLPKHLPFLAGLSSEGAERLAHAPVTEWKEPYRALAAQEYCVRLERNVRALSALGAPALAARPAQLERKVIEAYAMFRLQRRV